jgi:alpha-glucoside transport system permease protein
MARSDAVDIPRQDPREGGGGLAGLLATSVGRILIAVAIPLIAFFVLWQGFLFLRDSNAPKPLMAVVAITWGVGGTAALYVIANWLIGQLPPRVGGRLIPFLFVGPALAILGWYLLLPTLRTLFLSFLDAESESFVGLANYASAFTDPAMLDAVRNNVLWLVFGTGFSVAFGLLIAILAERSRFERLAKSLVFLPMVISGVGMAVIWRFVYATRPPGEEQIGLLNAFVTAFGGQPQGWLRGEPLNTLFLIVILVWAQTGFAMVVLSAALKGVPEEMLEAARIDGANELQVFRFVVIPSIKGAIVTVSTTIAILTLKVYDIVTAMTNGNFGTEVIATLQFKQMFKFFDYGKGSALAIILLLAVVPVIYYNLRQFRGRETFR